MEARDSFSSTSILNDPMQQSLMQQSAMQQEASVPHQPPSQSSQTYTHAPSGTGHGASGHSVTTLTEHVEPNNYQAAVAHQHRQALTPDQHDFSHAGAWATEPHADAFVIENDPILSTIHRAVDFASRENTVGGNTEAVGILRASLHRKV